MNRIKQFGLNTIRKDPSVTFDRIWKQYLPKEAFRFEDSGRVTAPLQKLMALEASQKNKGAFIDHAVMKASGTSVTSGNGICGATPLAFDPEIVSIYTAEAPAMMAIPQEGYNGFVIQVNRIDQIKDPIGYTTESDARDLSDNTLSGLQMSNSQFGMKIYADTLDVTDFAQRGAAHYMSVRDTALGDRVAAHARWKERAILYGRPGCGATDGNIFSTACFSGITSYANTVDKSSVDISTTNALLEDVKSEIKTLLQSQYNVNVSDLVIFSSHDGKDALENQLSPGTRVDVNTGNFDFGFDNIRIAGVPVIATHNIRSLTDGSYSTGDDGDIFITNTRDMRYRMLAPFTTIPLGRLGLAERLGLFEYGTLVSRANGNFSRYLSAYDI